MKKSRQRTILVMALILVVCFLGLCGAAIYVIIHELYVPLTEKIPVYITVKPEMCEEEVKELHNKLTELQAFVIQEIIRAYKVHLITVLAALSISSTFAIFFIIKKLQ